MADQHDDGGPAYPFAEKHTDGTHYHSHPGMSLRDRFALAAIQGLVARPGTPDPEWESRMAYKVADAMLRARKEDTQC